MTTLSPSILLVEDDVELAQWTADFLTKKGLKVLHTVSGKEAITLVRQHMPELVILDGMLPDLDGLDVCREVRAFYNGPILMLTARDEEIDEVIGLEVGADDYVIKPVRARALLARIRGLLRRHEVNSEVLVTEPSRLSVAGLVIDRNTRRVTRGDTDLAITSHEFDVIWHLASHAGEIISRETLVKILRGFDYDGFDRSIDLRISRLRKKLGDDGVEPTIIKTVWGKGYMMAKLN